MDRETCAWDSVLCGCYICDPLGHCYCKGSKIIHHKCSYRCRPKKLDDLIIISRDSIPESNGYMLKPELKNILIGYNIEELTIK